MKKIIVADDEIQISKLIKTFLDKRFLSDGSNKFEVHVFSNGNDSIEFLKENKVDLILSDIRMPNGNGIELLNHLTKTQSQTPFFFMTGFSGEYNQQDLIKMGAIKVFEKPFKCKDLVDELEKFLDE